MTHRKLLFSFVLIALALLASCTSVPKEIRNLPDGIYAEIRTDKGNMLLFLEHEKVPLTVANFIGLAEGKIENTIKLFGDPYYDGMTFHRIVPDFMIQGGDPNANGSGGPGYAFQDEFDPSLSHNRSGVLSMANYGKNTNGSQFFITHKETPWLDGRHSVFGHIVKGQDVVDAMAQGDVILQVRILRKGDSAITFDAPAVFEELRLPKSSGNTPPS